LNIQNPWTEWKYWIDLLTLNKHNLLSVSSSDLVKATQELQQKFIHQRKDIQTLSKKQTHYALQENLVLAYTLFYGHTNFFKAYSIFLKKTFLSKQLIDLIAADLESYLETPAKIFDLGCGPGVMSIGLVEALKTLKGGIKGQFHIDLVDHSRDFLSIAETLVQKSLIDLETIGSVEKIELDIYSGKTTVIDESFMWLFGHSLNEFNQNFSLAKKLSEYQKNNLGPKWIVILERASKEQFNDMLNWRESLNLNGYEILYPCASGSQVCPWKDSEKDWCHQILTPHYSAEFHQFMQEVKIDRRTLPMMGLVARKKISNDLLTTIVSAEESKKYFRLIRFLGKLKYGQAWIACGESINSASDEDELRLQTYKIEFVLKKLNAEQREQVLEFRPGDLVDRSWCRIVPIT